MGTFRRTANGGFALAAVLAMVVIVTMLIVISATYTLNARQTLAAESRKIPAFYLASAGVERTIARMQYLLTGPTASTFSSTTKEAAAALIVTNINTDNATAKALTGGTFQVQASNEGSGKVKLVSTGNSASGGIRAISLSLQVSVPPSANNRIGLSPPAAITTTGAAVDSGNAPVQGIAPTPDTARAFTITCPRVGATTTCQGAGEPVEYTVTVGGTLALPTVGSNISYNVSTTDPKSSILYRVTSVNPATRQVTLQAISETSVTTLRHSNGNIIRQDFARVPLPDGANLAPTTSVPAILTYASGTTLNGNNVSSSCTTYVCTTMSIPPDKLFQHIFGVTKSEFKSGLASSAIGTSDRCPTSASDTVRWADLTDPGADLNFNVSACSASTPRILIVDATGVGRKVKLNSSSAFSGLLYVIGDGEVEMTGNGSLGGALVAETGTNATNPGFKLAGTASVGVCGNDGNHDPKVCYDPAVLNSLLDDIRTQVVIPSIPTVARMNSSWAEVDSN